MLKRILSWSCALLAVLLLAASCGAETSGSSISPAELTSQEQGMLSAMGQPEAFFWDCNAPKGTNRVRIRLEVYKDGKLEPEKSGEEGEISLSALQHGSSFPAGEGDGRISAYLSSGANTRHRSSLGQTDYFDNVSLTNWTVRYEGKDSSGAAQFTTGYDLIEPFQAEDSYEITRYQLLAPQAAPLYSEVMLLCYGLRKNQSGSGFDTAELTGNPELLREYAYAYVLRVSFLGDGEE